MKSVNRNQEGGYIALLLVLIVSAVALSIALNLLSSGTDTQRSLLVDQQSAQARSLATACAEEALQQIHDNTSFTSTGTTMNLGGGSCSYVVSNSGSSKVIDASGNIGNATRKLKITLQITATNINITSWQDTI